MRGFVANTDFDWYQRLKARSDVDEVNHWQPSGGTTFRAIPPGAPFLFRLKRPHSAIAGFGFFAHASLVPASLAWEAFEQGNGAASLDELVHRVARYRAAPVGRHEDPTIGCRMITEPMFFDEADWVREPRDWSGTIVTGKGYDLTRGEGARVWEECLVVARELGRLRKEIRSVAELARQDRFGLAVEIRPRLGQGSFRFAVLDAYGRACAVTAEHSLPVLEAAHIRPYAEGGTHSLSNGLLLRSDLHRLFDRGFVTVTPDLRFRVSRRLRDLWDNGRGYYDLERTMEGRRIHIPDPPDARPDPEHLEWHVDTVFRG